MKAQAPGKLILSGEHSVVYGAPALAVAIAQNISVTFTPDCGDQIVVVTDQLGKSSFTASQLQALHTQLDQRFDLFLNQKISISEVLTSPFELLAYTLAHNGFNSSGTLRITSDIPVGAGMGSSAAIISALIKLSEQITGHSLSVEERFKQIRYCERLQHGRGSAVDAAVVTYGGAVKVQSDRVIPLSLALNSNWYLWHSGTPLSSTGEVVAAVREKYESSVIWQAFSKITSEFEAALFDNDENEIIRLVQVNHQLLQKIGVVPEYVSHIIEQIEHLGGAAKICGAGSVKGDAGGQVMIYLPKMSPLALEQKLNISIKPIVEATEGTHIATD
ncbi:MAG: mevalonate kinase [Neptuniibacter sp.]